MYSYSFDHTPTGASIIFTRERYQLVPGALRCLLTKIEDWNYRARQCGAPKEPYSIEADELRYMICRVEERLNEGGSGSINVPEMKLGTLRYIKAALMCSIQIREAEVRQQSSKALPSAVFESLNDGLQPLRDFADSIPYPPSDVLTDLCLASTVADSDAAEWDVFICHASEDKDTFVRTFAQRLQEAGLRVWYDEFILTLGDSLLSSIDCGLKRSRFGIVVLSPSFFVKNWPQRELDGLVGLENDGRKVVLPLLHDIDAAGVRRYSPILAGRIAASTSEPADQLVEKVLSAIQRGANTRAKSFNSQTQR